MCRRNQLRGCLLLGLGIGLLVGQCLESWLLCTVSGLCLLCMGFYGLCRK